MCNRVKRQLQLEHACIVTQRAEPAVNNYQPLLATQPCPQACLLASCNDSRMHLADPGHACIYINAVAIGLQVWQSGSPQTRAC